MTAVATFDLSPEFALTTTRRWKAVQTSRDEGPVLRREIWVDELERYELGWDRGRVGEVVRLRELWDLSSHGVAELTYTPPSGGAKTVVFDGPLELTRVSEGQFHIRLSLVEVR